MAENSKKQAKKPAKGQEKGKDKKANRRGAARLAAVQALYQMDIGGAGINDIFAEFESHWLGGEVEGDKYLPAEAAFFKDVVAGVVRDQGKLDPLI
ncbi:MAG TPA: transcription antitermination factor NusB, partial [Bradyrhizobium sp.]|nr:transcription antitermination factor NusB [Bradyrhizobium sp.]